MTEFEVHCPYPSCRAVSRLNYEPHGGETIKCTVCGDPFIWQAAYQSERLSARKEIRREIVNSAPPTYFPFKLSRRAKYLVSLVGLSLAIVVVGVIAVFASNESPTPTVDRVRATPVATRLPSVASTPTLREYWDLAACFDLFDRMLIAMSAGISDEAVFRGMEDADGALKRYGVVRVLGHCEDNYLEYYE